MLAEFYFSRLLHDMELAIQISFMGHILYRNPKNGIKKFFLGLSKLILFVSCRKYLRKFPVPFWPMQIVK